MNKKLTKNLISIAKDLERKTKKYLKIYVGLTEDDNELYLIINGSSFFKYDYKKVTAEEIEHNNIIEYDQELLENIIYEYKQVEKELQKIEETEQKIIKKTNEFMKKHKIEEAY